MAAIKIPIDGDSTGFAGACERGKQGLDKMKGGAKDLGSQMEQTFSGMAKGVLVVGAITKALEAATEAAKRLREASIKGDEVSGGNALTVSRALSGTGLTDQQKSAVGALVGSGAAKAEDTAGFVEALAKQQGQRLQGGQALELTRAFASGAFTSEELLAKAKTGQGVDVAGRFAALSPEARAELDTRTQLNQQAEANRQAAASRPAARFVAGELERRRLESPATQAVNDALASLPVAGGLFAAGEADIIEAQQRRARGLGGPATTIELGKATISQLSPAPRPLIGGQSPKE